MKVWHDNIAIYVQWDRRGRLPVPGRGTGAALAGLGLGYSLSDQIISAAVHAPGSWLTWQAITFIAGLLTFISGAALFAYRIAVPQPRRQHRLRLGELYLSELPGFVWILLAGKEYRRTAAGILERRARKADVAVAGPKAQCPAVRPGGMCCVREPHDGGRHRDGRGDEWAEVSRWTRLTRSYCCACGTPDPRHDPGCHVCDCR